MALPLEMRNLIIDDQGVRWDVSYEWLNSETHQWETHIAQFPRDFDTLKTNEVEPIMFSLAVAVAKASNVHE